MKTLRASSSPWPPPPPPPPLRVNVTDEFELEKAEIGKRFYFWLAVADVSQFVGKGVLSCCSSTSSGRGGCAAEPS